MNQVQLLAGFKTNTIELITDLLDMCKAPKLTSFVNSPDGRNALLKLSTYKTLVNEIPTTTLINKFIEQISYKEPGQKYTIRQMIKSHNESYFLNSDRIFQLAEDDSLATILRKVIQYLGPEEKNMVWEYMDCYMEICDKYKALS